jgi:hypothetical protein
MIHAWCLRWQIPQAAITDLLTSLGAAMTPDSQTAAPGSEAASSEAAVQNAVRMEAARRSARVFRNNVGAGIIDGRQIRWGLANDSAKINKIVKSSDLIGLTAQGRFIALECKHKGWHYTGTDRERAQLAFITLINAMGGYAAFITSPDELNL